MMRGIFCVNGAVIAVYTNSSEIWPSFASSQTAPVQLVFKIPTAGGKDGGATAVSLKILALQEVKREMHNLRWISVVQERLAA